MSLISNLNTLTPKDFIEQASGILFLYYGFNSEFKRHPLDLDDLVDGLLFIESKTYTQEYYVKQQEEAKRING